MLSHALLALLFAGPAANIILGVYLAWRFVNSALSETPTRPWFWLWIAGLAVSTAGYLGFLFGGIWLVLLGTIVYTVAAIRSRRRHALPG